MNVSDYLFAHPSFLSGAGRVLDLGGTFDGYNESPSPAEADRLAMRADWKAVGDALGEALSAEESAPQRPELK